MEDEDIILDSEAKIYVAFKYNSDNMSPQAVADMIRYCLESEGFGEILDMEIK